MSHTGAFAGNRRFGAGLRFCKTRLRALYTYCGVGHQLNRNLPQFAQVRPHGPRYPPGAIPGWLAQPAPGGFGYCHLAATSRHERPRQACAGRRHVPNDANHRGVRGRHCCGRPHADPGRLRLGHQDRGEDDRPRRPRSRRHPPPVRPESTSPAPTSAPRPPPVRPSTTTSPRTGSRRRSSGVGTGPDDRPADPAGLGRRRTQRRRPVRRPGLQRSGQQGQAAADPGQPLQAHRQRGRGKGAGAGSGRTQEPPELPGAGLAR
jgi:hypothetical protein